MQINSAHSLNPALRQPLSSTPDAKPANSWSRSAMAPSSAGVAKSEFDFKAHNFDNLKLGKQLYQNTFVSIHDVPGKNATMIKMNPNVGPLSWQLEGFSEMQKAGIPTASIQKCGQHGGMECALMQKFAQVHDTSTSGARKLIESNLTNQNTLNSLRQIRDGLEKGNLQMSSPTLGMEESGAVRVISPGGLNIPELGQFNKANLRTLDHMISSVQAKLNGAPQRA